MIVTSASRRLHGRAIVRVRPMTPEEAIELAWDPSDRPAVIELDDGTLMFASCDPEGNGPGALFVLPGTAPTDLVIL